MPVITIEFDNKHIKNQEIENLSIGVRKIVQDITQIEDVPLYANNSQIKVGVAPVEIFVRMSAHKIENEDLLFSSLKDKLAEWKKKNHFQYNINLTLIPMNWKIEINI